jgi:hypothetical protein
MPKIRETRRIGHSDFIKLEPIDKEDLNIEIGKDKIDIEDIVVVKELKKRIKKNE